MESMGNQNGAESGPANDRWYNPIESPRRYPLELDKRLHINLWSPCGSYKWTIAIFRNDGEEGFDLWFLADRPLDERVNWDHFRELIVQGQRLADERFIIESQS